MDLARITAMAAVIVIHAVAPVVETRTTDAGSATWWAANVLDAATRWCVPMFIMISGALLLDPAKVMSVRSFYLRRLHRVGIPLVVWVSLYLLVPALYSGRGLTVPQAATKIASGSVYLHLYFLFILLGLYVLTPFLRVLTLHAPRRMLWGFTALMLGLGITDQAFGTLLGQGEPNAVTRFLPYLGYFLVGWLLRDLRVSDRQVHLAGASFAMSWAGIAVGTGLVTDAVGWSRTAGYLYAFLSPPVVIMSVSAYILLRAVGTPLMAKASQALVRRAQHVAGLTFGAYLIHPALLQPLRHVTGIPAGWAGMLATVLGSSAAVFVVSLGLTWVLRRIPVLRQSV
jgi:surface polysaccharide O-acyltransferase-like enzyme